ncbi:MAG: ABC transporter ATP-binding protein/permease [Actinomycetota bacterium]|nr:ABC transporter ATP-binding protein/permease [Actinomycetota bacterium]
MRAARGADFLVIRDVAPWRALLAHIRPHTWVLLGGAALGLVGSAAGLAQPLVAKAVIDALSQRQSLVQPLLVLTSLVIASAGISAAGRYVLERTAENVVLATRIQLISRILRLRVSALDRLKPGDLLSRVTSDTTLLRNVCADGLVGGANAVFTLIGAIVLMAVLDVTLLGVTLVVIGTVGGAVALVMSRISSATERSQAAVGEISSVLERALGAFRTVKASGAEQREITETTQAARSAYRHGVDVARWTSLAGIPAGLAVQLSFLVVLGVGGARVASGTLAVSSLIAFLLYLFYLINPIGALIEAATQLHVGLAAMRRMREVEKLPGEPHTDGHVAIPPTERAAPAPASIAFSDVCFRYHDNAPLVHDHLTFTATPGEMTAIVGPSGAGKTTVFALLERFYNPERGTITLDGRDIGHWPLAELRSTIGYVEQDAPILAGTLRDNLRYAAPYATDDQIHAALTRAQLTELLERLPDGLDTTVGHRGTTLSGGERQRIAIARALLRAPRLLLLDEVTSQLDAVNESALRQVIADLAQTTTVIVIAHRLSTVTTAQQIVVMASGQTRANGTHAELVASDNLYRNLANTQLLAR